MPRGRGQHALSLGLPRVAPGSRQKNLLGALSAWTRGDDVVEEWEASARYGRSPTRGLLQPPNGELTGGGSHVDRDSTWSEAGPVEQLVRRGRQYTFDGRRGIAGEGNEESEQKRKCLEVLFDTEHPPFNMLVATVIVLNAITIALETDISESNIFLVTLEHLFVLFFLFEVILRVKRNGLRFYCKEAWHLFDLSLVVIGILDLWVLPIFSLHEDSGLGDMGLMRLLRMARVLRILRVLRVIRIFRMSSTMLVLTHSMGKALQVVMSISVLVLVADFIGAVFLTQMIGHRADEWGDHEEQIMQWFGSIFASMKTLFVIMTLDGWSDITEMLSQVLPDVAVNAVASLYIVCTSYTLVSLITAVLSTLLVQAQASEAEKEASRIDDMRKAIALELQEGVAQVDARSAVRANLLKAYVRGDAELLEKLQELDINVEESNVMTLIDSLADNDEEVLVDHFSEILVNISGNARKKDVVEVKLETKRCREEVRQLKDRMHRLEHKLDQFMATELQLMHRKLDALTVKTKGGARL